MSSQNKLGESDQGKLGNLHKGIGYDIMSLYLSGGL